VSGRWTRAKDEVRGDRGASSGVAAAAAAKEEDNTAMPHLCQPTVLYDESLFFGTIFDFSRFLGEVCGAVKKLLGYAHLRG
jgi:hypothetical protein